MTESPRAVVVGPGYIGTVHADALRRNGVEVAGFVGTGTAAGRARSAEFRVPFYTSLAEALASGPVDCVHVSTPNHLHVRNWRLDPRLGGSPRAIADIGSHWLDLAGFVTRQYAASLSADLATFVPTRRRPHHPVETFAGKDLQPDEYEAVAVTTEDYGSVLLQFDGGARGAMTVSQVSAGHKNRLELEINGAVSTVAWTSERVEELWIGHRNRANELLLRDPPALYPDARDMSTAPGGHAEGYIETHRALFREVYAAIAGGRPAEEPGYPTFADGVRSLRLGEAIAQSARERRWVSPNLVLAS